MTSWNVEKLDLADYLRAVGVRSGPPDLDLLSRLHTAHVTEFPFANVDVLFGDHPGVDLVTVHDQLVRRRRGGYCFEHAQLFAAVLERLGYEVERHLGRVGDLAASPRTHLVVVVSLDGRRYLTDPGFGFSLRTPMPLEEGRTHGDRWPYSVVRRPTPRAGPIWELRRERGDSWETMHGFDELPVLPVDVRSGHHVTSTSATSVFTRGLMVMRHRADRHVTVTHEAMTTRRPGRATEQRTLAVPDVVEAVTTLGVRLSAAERDRLGEVVAALRDGPRAGLGAVRRRGSSG